MTSTGSTAISTTSSGFLGADVDGLDKLAADFTQAAQVCDEVKMACEVIVAVASFFGPFGAGFIAYLKGTVIPWLQKISEALKLMAKVLSMHSQAQRNASSSSTSLPTYSTPSNLPTTDTNDYPQLGALLSGSGSTAFTSPPTSRTTPLAIGAVPISAAALGSTPNAGNDAVGVLSVPVRISADGTVSPVYQTPSIGGVPATSTATIGPSVHATPAAVSPVHATEAAKHAALPTAPGGGSLPTGIGGGGGSLGGGNGSSGSTAGFTPMVASSTPTLGGQPDVLISARTVAPPDLHSGASASHDGLYAGLGTATGIGAGGAALARAVLAEARQRADGSMLGAVASPFDADSDASAQAQIFSGSIG